MVPIMSIVFMSVSILVSVGLPVVLTIYFYRKYNISIIAVLTGALVFFVVQIVLRISILLPILQGMEWYAQIADSLWMISLILGFSAALFEEPGRLLVYKTLLKKRLNRGNAAAYGIGHGGIEAIFIVGLTNVNNIAYSLMINTGAYEKTIAPLLSAEQAQQIRDALVSTPSLHFLVGGIERIFAMTAHIAFSLLVFYAVKKKNYLYFAAAIVLHTLMNVFAVLLAAISIWLAEGLLLVFAAVAVYYIVNSMILTEKKA